MVRCSLAAPGAWRLHGVPVLQQIDKSGLCCVFGFLRGAAQKNYMPRQMGELGAKEVVILPLLVVRERLNLFLGTPTVLLRENGRAFGHCLLTGRHAAAAVRATRPPRPPHETSLSQSASRSCLRGATASPNVQSETKIFLPLACDEAPSAATAALHSGLRLRPRPGVMTAGRHLDQVLPQPRV
jgi:hypothetical protein